MCFSERSLIVVASSFSVTGALFLCDNVFHECARVFN